MKNPFIEKFEHYSNLATQNADQYRQASPFPHIYFDNFIPEDLCRSVALEFMDADSEKWLSYQDQTGVKLASKGAVGVGPMSQTLLAYFNSFAMIQFLEELTGISGLIPDPWYEGGGLHQIPQGGFLKVHADFNWHQRLKLDRRINVLLYLNENWEESYGGHLELWDRQMQHCEKSYLPIFNRCVVFTTTDDSFHGHPKALTCPESMTRKSIALYYYTNGRPESEKSESHTTIYHQTPDELERQNKFAYKVQNGISNALDFSAGIAHKPSGLLRKLAGLIRPKY